MPPLKLLHAPPHPHKMSHTVSVSHTVSHTCSISHAQCHTRSVTRAGSHGYTHTVPHMVSHTHTHASPPRPAAPPVPSRLYRPSRLSLRAVTAQLVPARLYRAQESRTQPNRAVPSQAEPNRTVLGRAEPSRAAPHTSTRPAPPSRAAPCLAVPIPAEPCRAEPCRWEPPGPGSAARHRLHGQGSPPDAVRSCSPSLLGGRLQRWDLLGSGCVSLPASYPRSARPPGRARRAASRGCVRRPSPRLGAGRAADRGKPPPKQVGASAAPPPQPACPPHPGRPRPRPQPEPPSTWALRPVLARPCPRGPHSVSPRRGSGGRRCQGSPGCPASPVPLPMAAPCRQTFRGCSPGWDLGGRGQRGRRQGGTGETSPLGREVPELG